MAAMITRRRNPTLESDDRVDEIRSQIRSISINLRLHKCLLCSSSSCRDEPRLKNMAPSASSSRSLSKSPPPPLHHSSRFTPIQECAREEEDEYSEGRRSQSGATPSGSAPVAVNQKQKTTPIPSLRDKNGRPPVSKARGEAADSSCGEDVSVSCNKCRPSVREKFSVVPLDNYKLSLSMASPNGIFKSIVSSLSRKSPGCGNEAADVMNSTGERWRMAFTELSNKLIQATRKRDEAILEASRLKYSMAELEKKLSKLETYCHSLKSGLDECNGSSKLRIEKNPVQYSGGGDKVVEQFLISVSESRSAVRLLSRSLTMQIRQMGMRVYERISALLQPFDARVSLSKNPRSLLFYLEALLNKAFYEDFESVGFQKNAAGQILNPVDRCEANYTSYTILQGLTWEEVLNKGTKHFSEEFSRFCDRKMSEIVATLGWNRSWSEPLLQAFFGASKAVWLVHLLANSVHPSLPIFRVDKEASFDPVYMEDIGGDRGRKLAPSVVRAMVAPGFYVYGNVVKCKVLCRYYNQNTNFLNDNKI